MDGQGEGGSKKKGRSTNICDVACQTDQSSSASIGYHPGLHQQPNQVSSSTTTTTASQNGGTSNHTNDTSSASASASSASGASSATSQTTAPPKIPEIANAFEKKLIVSGGPAGVKPNEIEAYFGEKKPPTGNNTTSQAPPGQTLPASQQSKTRAASTTGVVGEAKKQNPANTATSSTNAANGTAKNADGPSWNDESCKLRLVINRFSQLEETMCSPPKSIEGVSWKIMVMPKQHMVQKKQQKCMGFFLQCAPERAYSDQWSVHAVADMRMISYKPNVPHFARRTTHTYTSKENDWGYSCFMTWADIIDEGQGYIRDDTVVLEIAVKAEAPKNMMTHEDFLDKIEKWIVLADMQMKKGNIDLALEANQSAMKFCKGKDEVCYQRLETQRETFVNAKLFESIERIEKGPVVCTDTTHGKPTSLRQALTGAQKSLNGKMTAKGGKKTRAVVTVQHMKKKKPYDQNNTNQQRTNTGPTVKDLVEKRKNGKSEEAIKKEALRTKEEIDQDDQTESDESPDEKALGSDEEEEIEFDDEEYEGMNEGEYGSQNDGSSTLDMFASGNEDNDNYNNWEEDSTRSDADRADQVIKKLKLYRSKEEQEKAILFQGREDDIVYIDRQVQTDFEEMIRNAVLDETQRAMYEERLLAETVLCKFQDQDAGRETVYTDSYYTRTGINAGPEDAVETVFGGESVEGEDTFSTDVLDSLPANSIASNPGTDREDVCQLYQAEKMIKRWLDIEGALSGNVDPEGVLARLSDEDRRDLLEEINFKLNPLIVALDHEFRETVSVANNCLDTARLSLFSSQRMVVDCDKVREVFEDKLTAGFPEPPKEQKKQQEQPSGKKNANNSNASSGTKSSSTGRPTVIAKRSMKHSTHLDGEDESRGRISDFMRNVESANVQGDDAIYRMRDALEGFKDLYRKLHPMMTTINTNNDRVTRIFTRLCDENGLVAENVKKIMAENASSQNGLMEELKKTRESLNVCLEEKKVKEKIFAVSLAKASEDADKLSKALKEIKELKNLLKKAESKATKEENRAQGLQSQLNDIEEKAKVARKELDTLKKKTTDERAKTKKEKDRDSQTIRQQSNEINDREAERDKARKELEEANRQKEKFEKDKKAVAGQLASMTERARAAEVAVMESKWNVASEELKKRREAVQNGFTETETLANRVRQVSDRDMMRKSLSEWKAALDKIDAQTKSVKAEYDHATELIKNGVKTLSQTLDIKIPAVDTLPNLVKPPPVQVVAPSVIPAPIMPPTPAAGVIGQQRTPIGGGRQGPSGTVETPTSTPTRARVQRVPSPVSLKNPTRSDDAPSSLWSWNTIGNLGDLRPSSRSEQSFNSSMDSLQRDIWAANGNSTLGSDFLRLFQSNTISNGLMSGAGTPTSASPFLRSQSSQPSQQQQPSVNMNNYQQSQLQQHQQHHQNTQRMQQQQQTRAYGDMWNAQSMQPNSGSQDYGNQAARMMAAAHNGGGDLSNGQVPPGYSPWHNPPSQQQQLRGPTPQQQQQQAAGHHNMFQSHSFFDNGM
uniref:MATH domain-containing protein n=1 Tax=Caenorhabditis tropicalis TaxID=1561998 RepID=A0A1I7TFQ2_9PELO